MYISPHYMIRRATAFFAAVILVTGGLVGHAATAHAQDDKAQRNEQVDARLGLLEHSLRIWKLPIRYTAARSPYFRPGLPPYRQQPEKAQDQVPPGFEPEPVATPTPPTSGGSSSGSGSSSDSSSDSGDSDSGSSSGSSTGGSSSGGSDDGGSDGGPTPPAPGFGPSTV